MIATLRMKGRVTVYLRGQKDGPWAPIEQEIEDLARRLGLSISSLRIELGEDVE